MGRLERKLLFRNWLRSRVWVLGRTSSLDYEGVGCYGARLGLSVRVELPAGVSVESVVALGMVPSLRSISTMAASWCGGEGGGWGGRSWPPSRPMSRHTDKVPGTDKAKWPSPRQCSDERLIGVRVHVVIESAAPPLNPPSVKDANKPTQPATNTNTTRTAVFQPVNMDWYFSTSRINTCSG